mmetsp:Transcript_25256/g.58900  ORF Transcript_25256/g.58900 Transcript_25256/m.58900 type:complete len:200 (-) Transcript_25256:438-1037(-)
MHTDDCIVVFASDLPSKVAPKKVQNGISSQPHAMPHMSKAAFGQDASRKMPRKPLRSVKAMVHTLSFEMMSVLLLASSSSASNASSFLPARRAARVMKYGGSSPIAVPAPHKTTAGQMRSSWLKKVRVPSPFEPQLWKTHGWLYTEWKLVEPRASAVITTCMTKGHKNMMPECSPLPKPMDESTPSMSHQAASKAYSCA